MENKYYTPTIDEFFQGFEYEVINTELTGPFNKWSQETFYLNESHISLIRNINIQKDGKNKYLIRVKYLDKEDIESLDWKIEKVDKLRYKLDFTEVFSRDNWILVYYTSESILPNKVIIYNDTYTDCIFKGIIKNKSELIKVLKMLEIYGK